MAQFARPSSDVSSGSWTAQGGPSDLFDCLNESTPSDTDYCEESGGTTAFEVGLTSLTDPTSNIDHTVRWRWNTDGSGAREKMTIRLREGAGVTIATMVLNGNVDRGWTSKSYELTTEEADSISDYTDLRIDFTVNQQGGGESCWISWAEFEVPDAGVADNNVSEADDATIGESVTVDPLALAGVSETDGLTVGESLVAQMGDMIASESDGVTIGDTVIDISVSTPAVGDREVSETDGITIGDTPTMAMADMVVDVSDGLTVGDSATVSAPVEPGIPVDLGVDNLSVWRQGVVIYDG